MIGEARGRDRHSWAATPGDNVHLMIPEAGKRWRCAGCGNLTRFDITRARLTTEYWHFDLAGQHTVESVELLDEKVDQITCRWCARSDAIEVINTSGAKHS